MKNLLGAVLVAALSLLLAGCAGWSRTPTERYLENTAVGAAAGAAMGLAAGSVVGPVGAVPGAAAGAIVGGGVGLMSAR